MKALGHSDLQMTMHYVSLGKSHIREQVEKLNSIQLLPLPTPRMKALPASGAGAGRITSPGRIRPTGLRVWKKRKG